MSDRYVHPCGSITLSYIIREDTLPVSTCSFSLSQVFKIVSVDDYKVYALKEVYTKGVDSAVKKAYINEIQLLKNLKGQQEIITLYEW